MFRACPAITGALLALLTTWPAAVEAESLELLVAPLPSRTPLGPCPGLVTLYETPQPYREGSHGVDGRAPLQAVASGWRLSGRDPFSATWSATLLPAYRRCLGSAGIVRSGGRPYREHSHLRLRLHGGRAELILDMSGRRDANNHTPVIISAGVSQGVPVWSWAASD